MSDRRTAPKVGATEWKAVSKAKAERAKARKAFEGARDQCVLFVAGSATESAAYVKLAELRALLLETGEASIDAETAYDNAYDAWYKAMHNATRPVSDAELVYEQPKVDLGEHLAKHASNKPWDEMTEAEQAQAKSRVTTIRGVN